LLALSQCACLLLLLLVLCHSYYYGNRGYSGRYGRGFGRKLAMA
jgi:hypothetical protein